MAFLSPARGGQWKAEAGGVDRMDSSRLASQVMKAEVSQPVDPNCTVLVKFPKKYLPEKNPFLEDRLTD
ncbi:MAG TPA: hypothetical protein PLL62_02155 [Candidatus Saccharicenans sp.]|nr:hypothetical protein [Candidatus Saccharicenans sp.]HQM74026.1 hypothetical protein [Candidatus Saccharicenans sp.]